MYGDVRDIIHADEAYRAELKRLWWRDLCGMAAMGLLFAASFILAICLK